MATNRNITADDKVFQGTDRILKYSVFQADGTTPQDVTGWALAWVLRKKAKTPDPALILKTTGSGITITGTFNATAALNTQRVEVSLEDTDTYSVSTAGDPPVETVTEIRPGGYEYSLKRTTAGSETILAWGTFTLLQATARV